jgi:hypothetical protein
MPIRPYLKGGVRPRGQSNHVHGVGGSLQSAEDRRWCRSGTGGGRDQNYRFGRRGELEYRRLVERCLKDAGVDLARPSLGMASGVAA